MIHLHCWRYRRSKDTIFRRCSICGSFDWFIRGSSQRYSRIKHRVPRPP